MLCIHCRTVSVVAREERRPIFAPTILIIVCVKTMFIWRKIILLIAHNFILVRQKLIKTVDGTL
jgi:hypothetical protein